MNGAVNFLKPPGMTSSDAVVWLRWVLGTKKCGHGGTLDPAACGVLPVLVGSGTKLFDRMLAHQKTYAATIRFGKATDTLDAQGRVLAETGALPDDAALRAAMRRFTGQIEQTPPQYSAVRIGGRHAYALARSGAAVDMPTRRVTIDALEGPVWLDEKTATIRVRCSAGTYIRTLASDLAAACGSLGYLCALTREKSGDFAICDALCVEELLAMKEAGRIAEAVVPVAHLLRDLPALTLHDAACRRACNGAKLCADDVCGDVQAGREYRVFAPDGTLVGVFAADAGGLFVRTMLYAPHAAEKKA